jgi:protein-S-isoprenylcysteine O-methyltransferase Ste14
MNATPVHSGLEARQQARSRGPGAPLPSTLVYVAGFALGWWLHLEMPFWIDGDGPSLLQRLLGATFIGFGVLLFVWGLRTFMRERTGIMPQKPASRVVTSGPYQWTRNPMYVAFTVLYVGVAVAVNYVWPLVFLPTVLIVLFAAVIRREERYMEQTFGRSYSEYCRRVPRWL